jgi:hypothetical protein
MYSQGQGFRPTSQTFPLIEAEINLPVKPQKVKGKKKKQKNGQQ